MQTQIIKESINLLTDAGLEVHAVTFDGCSKNLTTARRLGCKLNNFDGSFPHPSRPDRTIHVILDVCHMLKLARNALGDKGVFYMDGGSTVCWNYIRELYNVQKEDVLHLGNKLKSQHIKWHNQKMKVAIAAQTLSNSVAAGIMYLKSLDIPQFKNSQPTTDFIKKINDIFDILNSKSKFGKLYKSPIKLNNISEMEEYLTNVINYLKELQDENGTKLVDGPRKTFILGFAVSSTSILAIAKQLLSRNYNTFDYVLTYRFSQDQLEMFFSKIRSRLGWNNNPNALQFKWALRALLQKNQITAPETANCTIIEDDKMKKEMAKPDSRILQYIDCSPIWRDDVLVYIGGYIVKKIISSIKCSECVDALVADDDQIALPADHTYSRSQSSSSKLISCKSYGKLIVPSSSVTKVVKVTDRLLRQMLRYWSSTTPQAIASIQRDVLQETKRCSFESLQQHSRECHILDENFREDHTTTIIKAITGSYTKIFLYRFGNVYSERIVREDKPSKRPKLTKLILFGND